MSPARPTLASGLVTLAATLMAVPIASPAAVATFPGDAGLLVFQQQTDEGRQLFTMPVNGGKPRQITHVEPGVGDNVGAAQPDWSPDGTRIAFAFKGCQIGLIDPDGGNLTLLTGDASTGTPGVDLCEADPRSRLTGKSIVFERYAPAEGVNGVWMMALDGTGRTPVSVPGSSTPTSRPMAHGSRQGPQRWRPRGGRPRRRRLRAGLTHAGHRLQVRLGTRRKRAHLQRLVERR